jgi:hypothetical protein
MGSMYGIFCSIMVDAVERWTYETSAGTQWLIGMYERMQKRPQQQTLPFDKETKQ